MRKIEPFGISTRELPADTLTPVGIYLRLRDHYPGSHLLECADYSSRHDAWSYICLNPIAGIAAGDKGIVLNRPGVDTAFMQTSPGRDLADMVELFTDLVEIDGQVNPRFYPGFFGYTSFDAADSFRDTTGTARVKHQKTANTPVSIPLLRYELFQVVLAFNHFNNQLVISELNSEGLTPQTNRIVSLLANRNATAFPFTRIGMERANVSPAAFRKMVRKGIDHCARGDVFQLVLSRRFLQAFEGDEFNVYRALRSLNPSPYLFYFDYLQFKLFGSSPEAQLRVHEGRAFINPIAGTVPRTGDPIEDSERVSYLLESPKENAEHCMLVDLARNDLSKHARDVRVDSFRQVQYFSHVVHLVSEVSGEYPGNTRPYRLFADTFPAGTLTGAPKHMALQLIGRYEPHPRGYYGGGIGFIGFDGGLNHAIMIRSFLSRGGVLEYQAGAGIVIGSDPDSELSEVNSKAGAMRKAILGAETFHQQ